MNTEKNSKRVIHGEGQHLENEKQKKILNLLDAHWQKIGKKGYVGDEFIKRSKATLNTSKGVGIIFTKVTLTEDGSAPEKVEFNLTNKKGVAIKSLSGIIACFVGNEVIFTKKPIVENDDKPKTGLELIFSRIPIQVLLGINATTLAIMFLSIHALKVNKEHALKYLGDSKMYESQLKESEAELNKIKDLLAEKGLEYSNGEIFPAN